MYSTQRAVVREPNNHHRFMRYGFQTNAKRPTLNGQSATYNSGLNIALCIIITLIVIQYLAIKITH